MTKILIFVFVQLLFNNTMMKKLMTKENGILLGVGVLAFVGVRYLLKKRDEKQSSFLGTTGGGNCSFYSGNTLVSLPCGETQQGGAWDGYTATCSSGGLGGCNITNAQGQHVATGTTSRPRLRTKTFSMADGGCGCGG